MTTAIDYASIFALLIARSVASTALVAKLGETDSIFERTRLDAIENDRPTLPWLVWSYDGISGTSNGMRPLNASAWAYADPTMGEKRLWDIASILNDLFGAISRHALNYGDLSITRVGKPLQDASLGGLLALETRIQYNRRS